MIRPTDILHDIRSLPPIQCGSEAKEHFSFSGGYINLNHGSFGTYPKCIKPVLRHYQDLAEGKPDKFIRYEYPALLDQSRAAVAKILNAPVEACTFLSNATTGINTVLRALEYEKDDVIITFTAIYGACEHTVTFITETTPAESQKVVFTYPIASSDICDKFESLIKEIKSSGKKPKLAIFDTIVSLPGVRMPFERLTELCRKHGVLSCIDGAHSIGQIDIDLTKLDPDFYVSNCHKWLYVPRGCAVFYVPVRNQHLIRSTIPTSHGYIARPSLDGTVVPNPLPPSKKSPYITNFEFVGTLDNSPYLCVPAAIEWRKKLVWKDKQGEQAIKAYIQWIALAAAELMARKLDTEVMDNEEKSLTKCGLTNVRLPVSIDHVEFTTAVKIAQWMAKTIVEEYNTFLAIVIHDNALWVRLSGQIYLTLDDFEHGAQTLLAVCQRAKKGEWES
ncbi:hypothetical protein AMS68_005917 [Peltaster fructicola]|uniref:Aminotransferase class V domain-containing protein n=1 Tax=Peltaster fructicola TaxID=286661 RepID=A0A6H0Y174_9PEZI|nr:hypothetical protein AMS68_005917 [Peltaster fructicola]